MIEKATGQLVFHKSSNISLQTFRIIGNFNDFQSNEQLYRSINLTCL